MRTRTAERTTRIDDAMNGRTPATGIARAGLRRLLSGRATAPLGLLVVLAGTLTAASLPAVGQQVTHAEERGRVSRSLVLPGAPVLHRPFAETAIAERSASDGPGGGARNADAPPKAQDADGPRHAEERFHADPPSGEDPDFLYLREDGDDTAPGTSDAVPAAASITGMARGDEHAFGAGGRSGLVVGTTFSFTPRIGLNEGVAHSLDLGGRARPIGSFTPRYREARVSLAVNPPAGRPDHALGIEVSSQYLFESGDVFGFGDDDLISPIERRAFHVGLSLNYQGFSLGAGVSREQGGLNGGRTRGFDVGFGWRSGGFETMVSLGGFTRSDTLSALVGGVGDENFYRLELGAAYQLSRRLRVSGGVRLFDYSSRVLLRPDLAERSGVLYLGTRLKF